MKWPTFLSAVPEPTCGQTSFLEAGAAAVCCRYYLRYSAISAPSDSVRHTSGTLGACVSGRAGIAAHDRAGVQLEDHTLLATPYACYSLLNRPFLQMEDD